MRIAYDTEFFEDGKTIELISIAMVREDDNDEIYAINTEFDESKIVRPEFEFVLEHVWPTLPTEPCTQGATHRDRCHTKGKGHLDRSHPDVRPRKQIRRLVKDFIENTPQPELWAYYGAYDHVAYAQLWGRMVDLPEGFPMFTRDIKQEICRLGNPEMPILKFGAHNAAVDARHNLEMLKACDEVEKKRLKDLLQEWS